MPLRRGVIALGLIVAAAGGLFVLQGLGVVRWPASSFMIGRQTWIDRGAIIAALGLAMVFAGRRLRR